MPKRKTGSKAAFHVVWKTPPNQFAEESFRTIQAGSHRIIVACPKGELNAGHCDLATKIEAVLQPKHEHRLRS